MIPFGLVAGFADGQEIRITELAKQGFCFRTLDEIREVKGFRICFYFIGKTACGALLN